MILRPRDAFRRLVWALPALIALACVFYIVAGRPIPWAELLVFAAIFTTVMALWQTAYRRRR